MRTSVIRALGALVLAASFAGCGGSSFATPSVVPATRTVSSADSSSATMVWITVSPASWTLAPGQSGGIQVVAKSGHALDAVSADPSCATVAPSTARPMAVPPGNHVALFTITASATGSCSTTIRITGNPKESVTVPVTVTG